MTLTCIAEELDNLTVSSSEEEPYERFYETCRMVTGLVFYPIICAVGLSGNSLAVIVFSHRKMATTSTNVFLCALAVADIIKLLNDLLYVVNVVLLRIHPRSSEILYSLAYPVSHYIFNQATSVAAWLTVSVAVERYFSVCHATRSKSACFVSRARLVSVLVFVSMSLATIPSALRYEGFSWVDPCTNITRYDVMLTSLGKNEQFMIAYSWMLNMLRSIIPLFALCALNSCIIVALQRRRRLACKKKWRAKNRITFMLVIVVVVFIVSVLPDAIMTTFFRFGYTEEKSLLVKGVREITDTLLALGSAVNFIIYCLCNKNFRDIFLELFCRRRKPLCSRSRQTTTVQTIL